MSEAKNRLSQMFANAMNNNLTEEKKRELEEWKEFATKNKLIDEKAFTENLRRSRDTNYNAADLLAFWNKINGESMQGNSGFSGGDGSDYQIPAPRTIRIFLNILIILGILGVMALVYLTLSNTRNHRFPVKSPQQRSFRF